MKSLLVSSVVLFFFSSCANLVPLSSKMIQKNNWTRNELSQIQYYVSVPITLQQIEASGQTNIEDGKIKISNTRKVEQVEIPAKTKGVAVSFPSENNICVSFEKDNEHYLTFGVNPDREGYYVLKASEWKNRVGKVTYNGAQFYTSPESADAVLLVNMKKVKQLSKVERVANGRKVD